MVWIERRVYAGDILEIETYQAARDGRKVSRSENRAETDKGQAARNEKYSQKHLTRLVNANFGASDLWLTLSYAPPAPEMDQALKDRARYIRKIRDWRRKKGLPELKYIAVTTTERDTRRIHHHILMSKMPMEDAVALWGLGRVQLEQMTPDAEHSWLARYIFRNRQGRADPEAPRDKIPQKRRWSQSRNLTQPIVCIKRGVKPLRLTRAPRIPRGYIMLDLQRWASDAGDLSEYMQLRRVDGKPNRPRAQRA
ncbi:MAG: hypothetical protein LBK75_11060 [Oscillospiraceae bacterium]|jgi:hypothetical protein|nr:hypothetical protein [Oscillospiraceae bacterium]